MKSKKKSQYAEPALDQLRKVKHAWNYPPLSFKNYARELEFLFSYYPDKKPSQLSREEVIDYVCYIKDVHHAYFHEHILREAAAGKMLNSPI